MRSSNLEPALATAAAAFEICREKSFAERSAAVVKAAGLMRARSGAFSRPVTFELGKLIAQARVGVTLSAGTFDYYASHSEAFLAPAPLERGADEAKVESSPFGVQPGTFPYYLLARLAAPILMAGNVVMVKNADCLPQCAIAFEQLWLDAGAPVGDYTRVCISYDQVNRVIDDLRIIGVALTGSVAARNQAAPRAGQNLEKSTLELGASGALFVLGDAKLDKTSRRRAVRTAARASRHRYPQPRCRAEFL